MQTCTATRKNGEACSARALPERQHCWAHDSTTATQRTAARTKGGRNRSAAARASKALPPHLVEVQDELIAVFREARAGTRLPRVAEVCARVAAVLLDFGKWNFEIGEAAELRQRLEALEAAAAAAREPRQRRWS